MWHFEEKDPDLPVFLAQKTFGSTVSSAQPVVSQASGPKLKLGKWLVALFSQVTIFLKFYEKVRQNFINSVTI